MWELEASRCDPKRCQRMCEYWDVSSSRASLEEPTIPNAAQPPETKLVSQPQEELTHPLALLVHLAGTDEGDTRTYLDGIH